MAGLAGLAIAELAAGLFAPDGSAVTDTGELIIDVLPAPLVNWGKETLGVADKPVLVALIVLAVLAVSAVAGQLELRRRYAGALVFAGLAGLGIGGVAARVGGSLMGYLPTVIGLVLGYVILNLLIARLRRQTVAPELAPGPASAERRAFLRLTVLVGAAATVAGVTGRALISAAGRAAEARARILLPPPAKPGPVVPAGADLRIEGLARYLTPNEIFYRIDTALQVPVIDPDQWTLTIEGKVRKPFSITFAELTARPLVEHVATLTCVSNEVGGNLAGNARWLGLPIRELLAEAEPLASADMVLSTSHDGWTAGTPLSALTDPDRQSLLAVGMNGVPLPVEHGFPVRMVVPGLYGYVSATKWVTKLTVTTFEDDQGYWTPLGWAERGPVKLASRIDVPRKDVVEPGLVVVAGVAWAQTVGISRVQVRVDEGAWREAELAEVTGPDTWRQWVYRWYASPGAHRLTVRATDANGKVQTSEVAPPAPDGATGWHSIDVRVREP